MGSRIALNALALRPNGSGVQTYIRELLRVLPGTLPASYDVAVQADALGEVPPAMVTRARPVVSGAQRAWHGMWGFGAQDLVHGLDVDIPLRNRAPTVITVHDLSVFDVPWAHSAVRGFGERLLIRDAVRRADAIVAVSEFTAQRVEDRFGRRATVTRLAPSPDMVRPPAEAIERFRDQWALPAAFVLYVGTVEPRKAIGPLAEACVAARVPLVIAGSTARGVQVPTSARRLGYVPQEDLPTLVSAARVLAYSSYYEGFGLPPVEAMACGTAVVTSPVGSLPEVLGDAAVFVGPTDVAGLASAMTELFADDDRHADLVTKGACRVRAMSWEETARLTADVYRSLGVVG